MAKRKRCKTTPAPPPNWRGALIDFNSAPIRPDPNGPVLTPAQARQQAGLDQPLVKKGWEVLQEYLMHKLTDLAEHYLRTAQLDDIVHQSSRGENAVHQAAKGSILILKKIIAKVPPDVLGVTDWECQTPLHTALRYNQQNNCTLLITRMSKSQLALRDIDGRHALHLAAYRGFWDVSRRLVTILEPLDIIAADRFKNTPLHMAVRGENPRIVQTLIRVLPPEELLAKGEKGATALHMALDCCQDSQIAELLLEAVPLDFFSIRDELSRTFLHAAIRPCHVNFLRKILPTLPSDILLATDSKNQTAWDLSIQSRNRELLLLFQPRAKAASS